jgi:signal peptidase I
MNTVTKRGSSSPVAAKSREKDTKAKNPQATRETVESIVVAVILAFLFRAFIAEAFVIPTGSMAPTLQGRHIDVACEECGYRYRTGASSENADNGSIQLVRYTTCPICRHTMQLQRDTNPNHRSFNGDRILVSKFAYLLGKPRRWDVMVFKYPGNAKQNYIKRLVGLPGETIKIQHGDIHVRDNGSSGSTAPETQFRIARKPANKVTAMLQLVHDSRYRSEALREIGWPLRWQETPEGGSQGAWMVDEKEQGFITDGSGDTNWLRYRHLVPWYNDWELIKSGILPERGRRAQGQLITDYYEYNAGGLRTSSFGELHSAYWVGDLALECVAEVSGDEGELLLDLVEGGVHYGCSIDVATGQARLSIDAGQRAFRDDDGREALHPTATTRVRGPGTYRIRYANVDDQVLLWVNGRLVEFDSATTYEPPDALQPRWSKEDPGDLAPLGIASRDLAVHVKRLRVLRDVYYVAVEADPRLKDSEYQRYPREHDFEKVLESPELWDETELFENRRAVVFELGSDEYFPLGDNSPHSKDARLWSQGNRRDGYYRPPHFVKGELLIGNALLIYWPHAWRGPFGLPLLPNFARMGLIR